MHQMSSFTRDPIKQNLSLFRFLCTEFCNRLRRCISSLNGKVENTYKLPPRPPVSEFLPFQARRRNWNGDLLARLRTNVINLVALCCRVLTACKLFINELFERKALHESRAATCCNYDRPISVYIISERRITLFPSDGTRKTCCVITFWLSGNVSEGGLSRARAEKPK